MVSRGVLCVNKVKSKLLVKIQKLIETLVFFQDKRNTIDWEVNITPMDKG